MNQSVANTCNRLLKGLSPDDLALLAPYLTFETLGLRHPIESPNVPIEHCYFVESGIISVVAKSTRDRSAEVGLVGHEGVTGIAIIMGDDRSPNDTYVQIAGSAFSLPAQRLRDAIAASPTLHKRLLHYAQAFLIQTVQTALANGTASMIDRNSWVSGRSLWPTRSCDIRIQRDSRSSILAVPLARAVCTVWIRKAWA